MRRLHALPAIAFIAAACGPSYSSSGTTTPAPAQPSGAMASMPHYTANLAAMNGSTVHGSATVHSMDGSQSVQVQISGGTSGATYPWHIHSGSCSDGMTPVVGNPQLYTALGTSGDGTASVMVTLPITLSEDQRYHVNVHASPSDMGTIIACGDLTR